MRRTLVYLVCLLACGIFCSSQTTLKNLNLPLTPNKKLGTDNLPRQTFRVPVGVNPDIDKLYVVEVYYNFGVMIPTTINKIYEYSLSVVLKPRTSLEEVCSAEKGHIVQMDAGFGTASGKWIMGPSNPKLGGIYYWRVFFDYAFKDECYEPTSFSVYYPNEPLTIAAGVLITNSREYPSAEGFVWYDAKGRFSHVTGGAQIPDRYKMGQDNVAEENPDGAYSISESAEPFCKVTFPLAQSEVALKFFSDNNSREGGFRVNKVTLRKASPERSGQSLDDYELIVNVTPPELLEIYGVPLENLFVCGVCGKDISVIKHERFDDQMRRKMLSTRNADGTIDIVVTGPFKDSQNIHSLRGVIVTPGSCTLMGLVSLFNDGSLKFPK